ncbi:MAG TPA: molybdenum ABC transporter ATP-binding protein [Bdellovibrionota bacterium]|nr:molybdenum ABC transporter ATP-binding protein [Bdellovibrionota bacterium]
MNSSGSLEAEFTLPLDRFTLDIALETRRHVTGLFGPSGCGKTSFLEVLAGLRRQSAGRIKLGETVWQDSGTKLFLPPEKRGIGYVPQTGLLFPHQTARQNLESGSRRARERGEAVTKVLANVVELLELGSVLERNVQTLSGGERQRVALGRALCSAPKLMLLDEPLAALHQRLRRKILPFLRRVREEFDIPMILVSHDPIEVQALCDDLVVLKDGSIIARGVPREVLLDPVVFPTADVRGFENVIPCTTVISDEWLTVVRLGEPPTGVTLKLPNLSAGSKQVRFVGIPARDILVATQEPKNISARNILPAVIKEVHSLGGYDLIQVSLSEDLPAIAVEVGRPASESLSLKPGRRIFIIIKSMTCTLYEERKSGTDFPDPSHGENSTRLVREAASGTASRDSI